MKKVKAFYKNIELRALAKDEDDGKKYIVGFIPYDLESEDFGEKCFEKLAPGCFSESLENNNVFALHNHDLNHVLGSTDNGTFEIEDTKTALKCTVELPPTSYADDLFEIVRRGDCKTLSFGFRCLESSVDYEVDKIIRTVKKAILDEVSFGVVFPAYGATTSEAEKRAMGEKSMIENIEEKFNEVLQRLDALEKAVKPTEDEKSANEKEKKEDDKNALESSAFEFEAENAEAEAEEKNENE